MGVINELIKKGCSIFLGHTTIAPLHSIELISAVLAIISSMPSEA
jgi:hypothetical protein